MSWNAFWFYVGQAAYYGQLIFTTIGIMIAVYSLFIWRVPVTWALIALALATICYYVPKG